MTDETTTTTYQAKPMIMASTIKPADEFTQAFRVVLLTGMRKGEFVTRLQNMAPNGLPGEQYWGHYFDDSNKAFADYHARCKQYGLNPICL